MHVAIVENTALTAHGQVGVALHEAGARIEVFRPWADGRLPAQGAHDALVVFGGEQSALDDARHPYLPALAGLMRATGEAGRPVLGICLGSQILARAYGGRNLLDRTREFGWHEIARTPEGAADPVLSAVPARFRAFQWHGDTFTLPPGATRLATGAAVENQCFRVGRAAYGMQFHFEASRAVVSEWCRLLPDAAEAMAPGWSARHRAEQDLHGRPADDAGLALATAWVNLLRQG